MMSAAFGAPQDFTPALNNVATVALIDDYGCAIFTPKGFKTYVLTIGLLPEGRGAWGADFLRASIAFMFTQTDALVLKAYTPKSIPSGFALARHAAGGYLADNTPDHWEWKWTIAHWIREVSSVGDAVALMRAAGEIEKADEVIKRMSPAR